MQVPPPTFCPPCRLERRLAYRNERSLYKRPCGLCGKDTITMYDPAGPIPSYCGECWWGDRWDPLSYGKEYDFSKPFFAQFRELMEHVPHQNLIGIHTTWVNTTYANMNHELKNCYLLFNADYDENCLYSEELERSKECMDSTMLDSTQLAYECLNCTSCYNIFNSVNCESSHDVWFSKNLSGCSNCFGCANLRNQQYCIFNKRYNKEEYAKLLGTFRLDSRQSLAALAEKAHEHWLRYPNKYMTGYQNLRSTGDYVYNSKDVRDSFIATGSERCRYCMWLIVKNNKDCYDYTQFGENTERIYEAQCCGKNIGDVIGGIGVVDSRSVRYSMFCFSNCRDLFGCVSLRGKQYCILNKQYTKESFDELRTKIIEQMQAMPYVDSRGCEYRYGEFFPSELSQFAYNETSAQEFFPLTAEEARAKGYCWRAPELRNYAITELPDALPDTIGEVSDDVVGKVIGCAHRGTCNEQCTTAFKIIEQELQLYRKFNLPLPQLCPNCRHYERLLRRNPPRLASRECQCGGANSKNSVYRNTGTHAHGSAPCTNRFQTAYAPDKPDIVYCEECYQAEVF